MAETETNTADPFAAILREYDLEWRLRAPREGIYVPGLDPGIERAVLLLRAAGIETYESCEGGPGHAYPEPTIRCHGDKSEGFRALDIALKHGLPVSNLRRLWTVIDGEPTGPTWELVFWKKLEPISPSKPPVESRGRQAGK